MSPYDNSNLVFTSSILHNNTNISPDEWFALEKASKLGVTAVYFRKFKARPSKPQIYIYDFTSDTRSNEELQKYLAEKHKIIWSNGAVPLVYVFNKGIVQILDCTKPVEVKDKLLLPNYLETSLVYLGNIDIKLKEYSAKKFDDGIFWEEPKNKVRFDFKYSAYYKLLNFLKIIYEKLVNNEKNYQNIIQKLLVQCILVKYLEEKNVFPSKYFKDFQNSNNFCDVLRKKGETIKLFDFLNENQFNGKIFEWSGEDRKYLESKDLSLLAFFLEAGHDEKTLQGEIWRQYSFDHLPVELISRIYEEFLAKDENGKQKNGIVYTPSHLVNFLIDECMPLEKIPKELNYKILDPACGSGIFLVASFKRLVQWWRLKNNNILPTPKVLKSILKNCIFGIDIDKRATQLTTFSLSLALCELSTPKQILHELKFDNLNEKNIINSDYFKWLGNKENKNKFDLIIGNPPFSRGKIEFDVDWFIENKKVIDIPQNQISLKFLAETIKCLNQNGLQCLIIHSPSILYNDSAIEFRKVFFNHYNVIQILDFTLLYRNQSLWDNEEPPTVAMFTRKQKPNNKKILHLTIRRTKAAKERILFEIDDYDYNFVTKEDAINCPYVWKVNLMGGGRLKKLIDKLYNEETFEKYLTKNKKKFNFIWGEGYTFGKSIPNNSFDGINGIIKDDLPSTYYNCYNGKKIKLFFNSPHLLIKKNIGEINLKNKMIPIAYVNEYLPFNNETVGIYSNDKNELLQILNTFIINAELYRFYIYCTSGKVLIYKNTAMRKMDIMNLPFNNKKYQLSNNEQNLVNDVLNYLQDFIRYGENSKVYKNIINKDQLISYGKCFVNTLNLIYEIDNKKFQQSNIYISKDYICSSFIYSNKKINPKIETFPNLKEDLSNIFNIKLSKNTLSNRYIKIYKNNSIIFIKPNQMRYWLDTTAYKDADKSFIDLEKQGY